MNFAASDQKTNKYVRKPMILSQKQQIMQQNQCVWSNTQKHSREHMNLAASDQNTNTYARKSLSLTQKPTNM